MNKTEYEAMLRSAGIPEDRIATMSQAFTTGELSGYQKAIKALYSKQADSYAFTTGELSGYQKAIKALYSKQADSYEHDHCNTYFGLRPTNLNWSAWLIKHKDDFIA